MVMGARNAFTLIELLVVVAIISILTSIAVPNFQHAQVKAKTTAALADMRSLATAVESYHLDHNSYPLDGNDYPQMIDEYFDQQFIQHLLTTPIAYISEVPGDIFHTKNTHRYDPLTARYFLSRPPYPYIYFSKDNFVVNHGSPQGYFLFSLGPDLHFDNASTRPEEFLRYDMSNGIVSTGDLLRKGP